MAGQQSLIKLIFLWGWEIVRGDSAPWVLPCASSLGCCVICFTSSYSVELIYRIRLHDLHIARVYQRSLTLKRYIEQLDHLHDGEKQYSALNLWRLSGARGCWKAQNASISSIARNIKLED